jgi:uncharacterized protein
MDRYQLATLASWAGENGIRGRKRMQKVVYFMQAAGCDLGCDFTLHHYGPYSRDVSETCDEMVASGLLHEAQESTQYNYFLPEQTQQMLADVNQKSPGRATPLKKFETLAKQLLGADLWHLELGSTILYFYDFNESKDWNKALQDACKFKKAIIDHPNTQTAFVLAKDVYHGKQSAA